MDRARGVRIACRALNGAASDLPPISIPDNYNVVLTKTNSLCITKDGWKTCFSIETG